MLGAADVSLDRPGNLYLPFLVSLVLHLLFLVMTWGIGARGSSPASLPFDVELLKPEEAKQRLARLPRAEVEQASPNEAPPLPRSQIVSPPESPEGIPDHARLLSDRNSRAEEETVKRGEPAPPAEPPRAEAKRAPASRSPEHAAPAEGDEGRRASQRKLAAGAASPPLPGLSGLLPKPSDLIHDPSFGKGSSGTGNEAEGPGERDYAAVPRPDLWADPGERGVPDYLPDVQAGRFTLLNTKADLFAPFVRRVGLRVFQAFSMDFKRQIFAGHVPQGKEQVQVEAVMGRDGRRLEVWLRHRSGNLATDRVLLATLSDQIFFDKNPPLKAVADDGRIHFVFELQASVVYGRDDPSGPIQPGAQWIFGAGLL